MSGRVLIVEHDPVIATDLFIAVEDLGFEPVGPAVTAKEGLDFAERETLGAALLDCVMMGETSEAVAKALAARGTPFLYVTGLEDPAALTRSWPDAPVLAKPLGPADLRQALHALMRA